MTMLQNPRGFRRLTPGVQPQYPVEIDRSHWLVRNGANSNDSIYAPFLRRDAGFWGGRNITTVGITSPTPVNGARHLAVTTKTDGWANTQVLMGPGTAGPSYVVFFVGSVRQTATIAQLLASDYGYTRHFQFRVEAGGEIRGVGFNSVASNFAVTTSGFSITTNEPFAAAFLVDGLNITIMARRLNGGSIIRSTGAMTGSPTTSGNTYLSLAARASNLGDFTPENNDLDVSLAGLVYGAFQEAEIGSFLYDPYQIFRPAIPMPVFTAAAGGVTGTGAGTSPAATGAGVAVRTITGTGAGTAPTPTATGAGIRTITGTAAGVAPLPTATGAGYRTIPGTGAASAPLSTGTGAAYRTITGTAAGTAPVATGAGTNAVADTTPAPHFRTVILKAESRSHSVRGESRQTVIRPESRRVRI